MSWLQAAAARVRLILGRKGADSRLEQEFAFHIDMETDRLVREHGLAPEEARRRALVAFGPAQEHRESLRDGRGTAWFHGMTLDFKLGFRVLRKYPGLTIVGVIGIAMAVSIATFMFTMIELATDPALPLPGGDRIVGIRTWDLHARASAASKPWDYDVYQRSLTSLDAVGAFRMAEQNLRLPNGTGGEMFVAEMTASAFDLAGIAPLLGRPLAETDEVPGTPRVMVISHETWTTRFDADRNVIGRLVRLGDIEHSIVGVMPKGFAYPVAQDIWVPLRMERSGLSPGDGPTIYVVGRLACGVSRERAQIELATVASRVRREHGALRDGLEPRIVSLATLVGFQLGSDDENIGLLVFLVPLLLVVVSVNVATLVYARTASRHTELAVRQALGASRRRVIGQLFAEALVLSGAGSLLGLAVSRIAFNMIYARLAGAGGALPFWIRPDISPSLVLYVIVLVILAALIIGVLPARGATFRDARATLAQLGSGDTVRLGRAWTVLIVTQVGIAVAVLPSVVMLSATYGYYSLRPLGFPTGEYLTAFVEGDDRESPASRAQRLTRLEQRLETEAGISAVSYATHVIGQEPHVTFTFDTLQADSVPRGTRYLRHMAVAPDFMDLFGISVRAGRGFSSGDFAARSTAVLVNEEFVREFLDGKNAIGHRVRRVRGDQAADDRWLEIVGVVNNFPPNRSNPEASESRIYEPMRSGERFPLAILTARATVPPAELTPRVHAISLETDPILRVNRILSLDAVYRSGLRGASQLASLMMGLITLCILVLSGAGMSSLLSFAVTRRRREIGIRSALGGKPSQVLSSIFARVLRQLAGGIAVGLFLSWALNRSSGNELLGENGLVTLSAVIVLITGTCILAALGPSRRGLRVHPAEALKSE